MCGKTGKKMNNDIKIKISTAHGGKPFIKQLPQMLPQWQNCTFYINEDIPECDLWVVYGGIAKPEKTICPEGATVFISNEPPSVKTYSNKFLKQFGAVITCKGSNIKHPNVIYQQQSLPWWVGHKVTEQETPTRYEKTYDDLLSLPTPKKQKLLSVLASNKTFTKGHRARYEFVKLLQQTFPDMVDVFGIGFNTIEDKWDAIAPYKYHIVIENSTYEDYWTEKLSDCFLGESYPLYHGCRNIEKYFSSDMITNINISKPYEAIEIIKKVVSNNTYEKSTIALQKAKDLVLNQYQLFPAIARYANTTQTGITKNEVVLVPETKSGIVVLIKKITRKMLRL